MKRYITEILLLFHLIFKESTSRAKVQNLLTRFFSFLRFLHIINPWGPMHRLTKSHDSITYIKHVICKKQNMLSCHSENFEAQNQVWRLHRLYISCRVRNKRYHRCRPSSVLFRFRSKL